MTAFVAARLEGLPDRFLVIGEFSVDADNHDLGLAELRNDERQAEQGGEHLQLLLASDQRVRRLGQRPGEGCGGSDLERGVLLEDPPLQLPRIGAGLEPELLIQSEAEARVVLQRLRLPSRAVEREHRLPLQPLP